MIKTFKLFAGLTLLPILSTNSFADCIACTVSYGVTIKLKSGRAERGYIPWNHFFPEQFPEAYDFNSTQGGSALLTKAKTINSNDTFDYWLELVNYATQNNLPVKNPHYPRNITVYHRLVKIAYPRVRFVAIKGDVAEVKIDEIAKISIDRELPLHVDTTGIDALPEADVQLLSQKKPRFTVESEGSVGATVYAVYGEAVALADVLEHVAYSAGGDLGDVLVNQVRIRGGHNGAGPAVPLAEASELGLLTVECQAFLDKLGESTHASCEAEQRAIQEQLNTMPLDDPKRSALFDRQHQLRVTCMTREPQERRKWKSLGSKEEIRRLGILVSSYSWD